MRFFGALRRAKVEVAAVCVVLAVIVAPAALAGRGVGGTFHLGKGNKVNQTTELRGQVAGASLRINNNSADPNATALGLKVEPGQPPMKVDSTTTVFNLSADLLDGMESSDFVPTSTNSFVRNNTYRVESAIEAGTVVGDGTSVATKSCDAGDRMLSGGPANLSATSDLIESFPASTTTWQARVDKNGQTDNWNVVVLCANQN